MHHGVSPVFSLKSNNIDRAVVPQRMDVLVLPASFPLCFRGCMSPDLVQELIASGEVGLRWSLDGGRDGG